MSRYYKLDEDHKPVPCDVWTWSRSFDSKDRIVAQDKIGDADVSTVFLGLDHRFSGDGPPVLFETMIFGGPHDGFQERCCTWDEAVAMHARALEVARGT